MSGYSKTGPFVSDGAPGIDYVFLNNVETYLAYAADSSITTNGSGVLTMLGLVVNGNATINGSITTTGGTLNVSSITVSGNETVTGNIAVAGTTSLDNGKITTDGAGALMLSNNTAVKIKDVGGTARSIFSVDASNNVNIQAAAAGGNINLKDQNGTTLATMSTTGFTNNQNYIYKNGNLISRISTFTGTGSGTYNHNMGGTPTWVCAVTNTTGSATQGFDSAGSSTVHITLGASNNFTAFCIRDQ